MLESQLQYNSDKFVLSTIRNIKHGVEKTVNHDTWIAGTKDRIDLYCLAKTEIDADGELVYTAYQLWIKPELRTKHLYKRIVKFLRFYSTKCKYKRLYIISSRIDKFNAYQRGIGYNFKPKFVTFSEDYS